MRRPLLYICWSMLFLSIAVISCCASSNYGLYNISLIPGTEVTNFTWSITFTNNNEPVLTTDYPIAKINQYGVTAMDFSYYHNGDWFCDFTFTYSPNNPINTFTFTGYGIGQEVMNMDLQGIVSLVKEYGLTSIGPNIIMKGSTETKELFFNASEMKYLVYHHSSNDFDYGNGFHYQYSYDENGFLEDIFTSHRKNSKDLYVDFDKYGRIDSAYFSDEG